MAGFGKPTHPIVDPFSKEAEQHAELYYASIQKFSTDVEKIAKNTGFTPEQILAVKNYLFKDEHMLDEGIKRFDPSFHIAQSWQRLAFDPANIKPHDITLLNHELTEMKLVNEGHSMREAHDLAEAKYDYTLESDAYYQALADKKANKPFDELQFAEADKGDKEQNHQKENDKEYQNDKDDNDIADLR